MTRFPTLLIALGATLLFALLAAGCQNIGDALKNAPRPEVRITSARLLGLGIEKVDLAFNVEISNPYPAELPLTQLGYALDSGGQRLFEGTVKPSGGVPARGTRTIEVPISVAFRALQAILKDVRPGSVLPYKASFTVGLDAPLLGALTLPLSYTGELPVPAVPQVSLARFDLGSLSLDRVEATARLRLKNTNSFDLDLARLALDLKLGGERVANTGLGTPGKLAAGQEITIDIPMSFSPKAFGLRLFNLLGGSEAGYSASGSLEVGTRFGPLSLPFNQSGDTKLGR